MCAQVVKSRSFHPKHVQSLYVAIVLDVVHIYHPLSVAFKHWCICDAGPSVSTLSLCLSLSLKGCSPEA
jgi:hypothetical protein